MRHNQRHSVYHYINNVQYITQLRARSPCVLSNAHSPVCVFNGLSYSSRLKATEDEL